MSFLAKMSLGSNTYTVLNLDYEIYQPIDNRNQPSAAPKGGTLNVVVESSNQNELLEWMISHTMQKSGSIIFTKRDTNASMKTITFKDAFCIKYREVYNADGQSPMQIFLTISARELDINSYKLTNKWPGAENQGQADNSQDEQITSFYPSD